MTRPAPVPALLPPHLAAYFVSRPVQPSPRGKGLASPRGVLAELAGREGV